MEDLRGFAFYDLQGSILHLAVLFFGHHGPPPGLLILCIDRPDWTRQIGIQDLGLRTLI